MCVVQVGKLRLKKRHEFLRTQRSHMRFKGLFLLFTGKKLSKTNEISLHGRFGLVTPKSVGKAHERNRIKRRLRHLLYLHPNLIKNRDVVILASNKCVDASFESLRLDFVQACIKLEERSKPPKNLSHSENSIRGKVNVH